MKSLQEKTVELRHLCMDCKHFSGIMTCKAFDLIPEKFLAEAESHTSVVPGQNGDYVFETDKPRHTRRAFYFVDVDD